MKLFKVTFVLLVLLFSGWAAAHNRLLSTTPEEGGVAAPGSEISVSFNLETYLLDFDLLNPSGESVLGDYPLPMEASKTFAITVPANAQSGEYTVHWKVEGADTHQLEGSFTVLISQ